MEIPNGCFMRVPTGRDARPRRPGPLRLLRPPLSSAAAVLAGILAVATAVGRAQVLTCQASAVPPLVRSEGVAELLGDIVILCSSIVADPPHVVATDLTVTLNTWVTNNRDFGHGPDLSDAVLIINEAEPAYYGAAESENALRWSDIHLAVPRPGVFRTLRVSNIRANAAALFEPGEIRQVVGLVSLSSPDIALENGELSLGILIPIPSLVPSLQTGLAGEAFRIRLSEGFATAFKTLGTPTVFPGTTQVEDGFLTPGSGLNDGGATQATRFLIRFLQVPEGTQIWVPSQVEDSLQFSRVLETDAQGAGGVLTDSHDLDSVPISKGMGMVVYEVTRAGPFMQEGLHIPVYVDPAKMGMLQVSVSFAPVTEVYLYAPLEPRPRFVDTGVPMTPPAAGRQ